MEFLLLFPFVFVMFFGIGMTLYWKYLENKMNLIGKKVQYLSYWYGYSNHIITWRIVRTRWKYIYIHRLDKSDLIDILEEKDIIYFLK